MIAFLLCFLTFASADEEETWVKISKTPNWPKRIYTGSNNFVDLIKKSDMVIDKSYLIPNFFEDPGNLYVITCPPKWGKSVNLNMIRLFLELNCDERGIPVNSIENTAKFRIFIRGDYIEQNETIKEFHRPFMIFPSKQEFVRDHFIGYPLIHIKFGPIEANDYNSMLTYMLETVQKEYIRHEYIKLAVREVANFTSIPVGVRGISNRYVQIYEELETASMSTDPENIKASIRYLSDLLSKFFRKPTIVLMDDYSRPWEYVLRSNTFTMEDKKKFLQFYIDFMNAAFEMNPHLKKGIVTGVHPLSEELRNTAFSRAVECNWLTNKFMEHYGITQRQIRVMYPLLNVTTEERTEIRKWYGGYLVNRKNVSLHNLWSVASFSVQREYEKYWIKANDPTTFLKNCLKLHQFREQFEAAIRGVDTTINIPRRHFTWNEYEILFRAWNEDFQIDDALSDQLFLYLFHLGYMTVSKHFDINNSTYYLKIPNHEINDTFKLALNAYQYQQNVNLF